MVYSFNEHTPIDQKGKRKDLTLFTLQPQQSSKAFAYGEFISFYEKKKRNQRKVRPILPKPLRFKLNHWPLMSAVLGAFALRIILMLRFNDLIYNYGSNIKGFGCSVANLIYRWLYAPPILLIKSKRKDLTPFFSLIDQETHDDLHPEDRYQNVHYL